MSATCLALWIALDLWLGVKAESARQQQEAVTAIRKLGGRVMYDYQKADPDRPNVFDPGATPKAPKALRELFGEESFRVVVLVNLRDTNVTDDDLKHLKKLPYLENVDLTNTRITGAGLAHLRGLKNLRCLGLWKTRVDDAGLEHLKGRTKLWQLFLDETNVTDAGAAHLKGLTNLEEWLGLTDTRVTDKGLRHLKGLTKLRFLNLRRTRVTGAGVRTLQSALPSTDISFGP